MAKRYLSADNSRGGKVTAVGPTFAHIRGWQVGVRVESTNIEGTDWRIYMTSGSGGSGGDKTIGTVLLTEDGPAFIPWPSPLPH